MRRLLCSVIIVLLSVLALPGCGPDPGKACSNYCADIRDQLIENFPDIAPQDVVCDARPWSTASSCEECKQILNDLFDVSAVDQDCGGHF